MTLIISLVEDFDFFGVNPKFSLPIATSWTQRNKHKIKGGQTNRNVLLCCDLRTSVSSNTQQHLLLVQTTLTLVALRFFPSSNHGVCVFRTSDGNREKAQIARASLPSLVNFIHFLFDFGQILEFCFPLLVLWKLSVRSSVVFVVARLRRRRRRMWGFGGRYYWERKVACEKVDGIVVVFAWMSSEEKHLMKYVELYSSIGWNSLVCHSQFLNMWVLYLIRYWVPLNYFLYYLSSL